ncbi:hypothetical protein PIB30_102526 [Stylosanthes scabra]|uniref:Uncharacterized protein n=1 Tax=Stylosanthes scabra TaxID=79078 RepID=A0ABU6SZ22_9FABA|nr:hypothetical protein [Stylosanthes scabra]
MEKSNTNYANQEGRSTNQDFRGEESHRVIQTEKFNASTTPEGGAQIQKQPAEFNTQHQSNEDAEMQEPMPEQDKQGMSEEKLAREINVNLHIKSKRDETCQLLLEDGAEADTNINNMQIVLKKQKYDDAEKWAEEAGLNKPHSKP